MHHTCRILEYFFSFRWKIDSSHLNRINLNVFKILSLCWRWFVWECKETPNKQSLHCHRSINVWMYTNRDFLTVMPANNRTDPRSNNCRLYSKSNYIYANMSMSKYDILMQNNGDDGKHLRLVFWFFDTIDLVLRIFLINFCMFHRASAQVFIPFTFCFSVQHKTLNDNVQMQ